MIRAYSSIEGFFQDTHNGGYIRQKSTPLTKLNLAALTFCFFLFSAGLAGFFNSDEGPVEEGYDDTKPDGSHPAIMG